MTFTATGQDTRALLLWKQGTPKTRLGDVVQDMSLTETEGYVTLADKGLDALKQFLETPFAPGNYVQLAKSCIQYKFGTRCFKEDMPCFITRLEPLERDVKSKEKDIITSPFVRPSILLSGAGLTRNHR